MLAESAPNQPNLLVVVVIVLLAIAIAATAVTRSFAPLRRFFDMTSMAASLLSIGWLLLSFLISWSVNEGVGSRTSFASYLYNVFGLVGLVVLTVAVYFINFIASGNRHLPERLYEFQKFVPIVFALVNFIALLAITGGN